MTDLLAEPHAPSEAVAPIPGVCGETIIAQPGPFTSLQRSPQQLKVAQLLVQGLTCNEAAQELGRSPRTIEMHRAYIVKKTGLDSLAELTHAAIDANMIPLPAGEKFLRGINSLSQGERNVLALVTSGDQNKIIAHKLGLSVRTVESYRANAMTKMGIDNVAGLVCAVRALHLIGIEVKVETAQSLTELVAENILGTSPSA